MCMCCEHKTWSIFSLTHLQELGTANWPAQEPNATFQTGSLKGVSVVDNVKHIVDDETVGRTVFFAAWCSLTDEGTNRGESQVSSYHSKRTGSTSLTRTVKGVGLNIVISETRRQRERKRERERESMYYPC